MSPSRTVKAGAGVADTALLCATSQDFFYIYARVGKSWEVTPPSATRHPRRDVWGAPRPTPFRTPEAGNTPARQAGVHDRIPSKLAGILDLGATAAARVSAGVSA